VFDFEALMNAMGDLNEPVVMTIIDEVVSDGLQDAAMTLSACQKGMEIVGNRFESGEYYVGDLIFAGELMAQVGDRLGNSFIIGQDQAGKQTKVILCTVKDDLHDIGKNIVKSFLIANSFQVIDLGIDCSARSVVNAVEETGAKIVALSGVLFLAVNSMKAVVEALKSSGHEDVKVLIGGMPVSEAVCKYVGADAWAHAPERTVKICLDWAKQLGETE
jgi:methanogenic corrinoid protein MtbC1